MKKREIAKEFLSGELPERNNPVAVSDKVERFFRAGLTKNEIKKELKNYGFNVMERETTYPNQSCIECDYFYVDGRMDLMMGWGRDFFAPKYSLVVTIGFKDGLSHSVEGWMVKNLY